MHLSSTKLLCNLALMALVVSPVGAGEPFCFPWGAPQRSLPLTVDSGVGHVVLPGRQRLPSLPVYLAPPKPTYAYGWFGSNPIPYGSHTWGRHFGYSQNFTQWTSR